MALRDAIANEIRETLAQEAARRDHKMNYARLEVFRDGTTRWCQSVSS